MSRGHPSTATERALQPVLARLLCEHTHGSRPPKVRPCRRHVSGGEWLAYVLAGHVAELTDALAAAARELLAEVDATAPTA